MKFWLNILVCLISLNTFAQKDTVIVDSVQLQLKKSIAVDYDYFSVDQLGNIYVVKEDVIKKYNNSGEFLFKQSFKSLGDIFSIDVSQSLRTLLFYRDLTQIVFTDNSLSMQGSSIKFEKHGYEFAILACASFVNNHFWIYRTDEFRVERLDKQLNKIASSSNIVQLLRMEINPNFMIESGELLYLNDPNIGIMIFDIFGTYIQTLPIKNLASFQILDKNIIYLEKDNLMVYNTNDFSLGVLPLKIPELTSSFLFRNTLVTGKKGKIEIYTLLPK